MNHPISPIAPKAEPIREVREGPRRERGPSRVLSATTGDGTMRIRIPVRKDGTQCMKRRMRFLALGGGFIFAVVVAPVLRDHLWLWGLRLQLHRQGFDVGYLTFRPDPIFARDQLWIELEAPVSSTGGLVEEVHLIIAGSLARMPLPPRLEWVFLSIFPIYNGAHLGFTQIGVPMEILWRFAAGEIPEEEYQNYWPWTIGG